MYLKVGGLLFSGPVYIIKNFVVEPFTSKNRCFEEDNHIILTEQTIITKVDESCCSIADNVFFFVNLKNIHEIGLSNSCLVGKFSKLLYVLYMY